MTKVHAGQNLQCFFVSFFNDKLFLNQTFINIKKLKHIKYSSIWTITKSKILLWIDSMYKLLYVTNFSILEIADLT